jgi:serine/threonine protein phosphatase PrpC
MLVMRDGRLTAEEAAVHPHRSILSRALGTEPAVTIDEFAVGLRPAVCGADQRPKHHRLL